MTLPAQSVPRATLDQWPLAEVGLPFRAVRALREAKVLTVAELRRYPEEKLLKLWSFGQKTLDEVREFFALCDRIEQGRQSFRHLPEVIERFLPEDGRDILQARFRLNTPASATPWKRATLHEIGTARKLTRERVRQIEQKSLDALHGRLAQVCLAPCYDFIATRLARHEHVADAPVLLDLQQEPPLGGWQPAGALALLAELNPDRVQCRHNLFFTLSPPALQHLEQGVLGQLNRNNHLPTAAQLLDSLRQAKTPALPAGGGLRLLNVWLDHHPDVVALADGRYFGLNGGVSTFLAETARELHRPFHYRHLLEAANRRLKPESRRGAGAMLEWLAASPAFTRIGRGLYDYKV